MADKLFEELLKDESFLNFCLNRSADDVLFWQNWILEHPDQQQSVNELRTLVIRLRQDVAEAKVRKQFSRLKNTIDHRPAIRRRKRGIRISIVRNIGLAASLLIFASVAAYFYMVHQRPKSNYLANKAHDIAAGGERAELVLSNGRKINLSTAKNGVLTTEGNVQVAKEANGQLVYQPNTANAGAWETINENTIRTPAGGQYAVLLPDGSKVWLNAHSELTYPVNFSKGKRSVRLRGEAYFEIAHVTDPQTHRRVPFIVDAISGYSDQLIQVIGTHFNVNCYSDEPVSVTSLLEGKISVSQRRDTGQSPNSHAAVLIPGQELRSGKDLFQVGTADVESSIAWKNGDFVFREDIRSALRKVARWYDVEIIYTADAPKKLTIGGYISKKDNISDVLNLMEATGKIHLKLEGRRVLVTE